MPRDTTSDQPFIHQCAYCGVALPGRFSPCPACHELPLDGFDQTGRHGSRVSRSRALAAPRRPVESFESIESLGPYESVEPPHASAAFQRYGAAPVSSRIKLSRYDSIDETTFVPPGSRRLRRSVVLTATVLAAIGAMYAGFISHNDNETSGNAPAALAGAVSTPHVAPSLVAHRKPAAPTVVAQRPVSDSVNVAQQLPAAAVAQQPSTVAVAAQPPIVATRPKPSLAAVTQQPRAVVVAEQPHPSPSSVRPTPVTPPPTSMLVIAATPTVAPTTASIASQPRLAIATQAPSQSQTSATQRPTPINVAQQPQPSSVRPAPITPPTQTPTPMQLPAPHPAPVIATAPTATHTTAPAIASNGNTPATTVRRAPLASTDTQRTSPTRIDPPRATPLHASALQHPKIARVPLRQGNQPTPKPRIIAASTQTTARPASVDNHEAWRQHEDIGLPEHARVASAGFAHGCGNGGHAGCASPLDASNKESREAPHVATLAARDPEPRAVQQPAAEVAAVPPNDLRDLLRHH
ncbi:hypothetical protein HHL14_08170 [Paraburkholderia sp. G-4-1-8]|uniref:Uncharacterized protein n=2 Tax=Paraburkholderia antibiotica TaxID=2728839 RepID=A0A7X9X3L0_9BURK|nr:hypothetical protein [Paraburkholderia antibiotica]